MDDEYGNQTIEAWEKNSHHRRNNGMNMAWHTKTKMRYGNR
jgi:hypothetical protein